MTKLNYDLWAFVVLVVCVVILLILVGSPEAEEIRATPSPILKGDLFLQFR